MKLLSTALFLWLAASVPAQSDKANDAALLADFPKYMKSKSAAERVGQVEALAFVDGPEATRLLISLGLTDKDARVARRAAWALSRKESPAAIKALIDEGLTHRNARVRIGVARALQRRADGQGLKELAALIPKERNGSAKAAYLEALAAHESSLGNEAALASLETRDLPVLLAALDALGASGDVKVAPRIGKLLRHKDWKVKSAALAALGRLRARSSIPVLIDFMAGTRGRLLGDARAALMAITGNQYGSKAEVWQRWWDRVKDGWQVPETLPQKKADLAGYDTGGQTPDYCRIKAASERVLDVLDLSASMNQFIRYQPRAKGGRKASRWVSTKRIRLAKKELIRVLKKLKKNTSFDIVAFDATVQPFRPRLVPATPGNISSAVRWVEELQPWTEGGAYTKEGWQRGETNLFAAIKWIFGIKGKGIHFTGKLKPLADTVFLLADGEPTCGELIVPDEILAVLEEYHEVSRVTIHTISFDLIGIGRQFLVDVARITGGTFVELGAKR